MAKIPEEVLLGMIANAGGGGGTSDYSQLANKPQINGVTLSGDKSASDLSLASLDANGKVPSSQLPSFVDDVVEGYYDTSTDRFYEDSTFETVITPVEGKSWVNIPANKSYRWTGSVYVRVDEGVQIGETSDTAYAGNKGKANADAIAAIKDGQTIDSFADVENALSNKQNKLTAGNYIAIENDGTIKVTQGIGVYDVYSYKIEGRASGNQYYTNVIKSKNGVQQSSNTYYNTQATTPINIDDRFTLKYVMGEVTWHVILLTDSTEHSAGEDISWKYNVTKDFTETFNVSQDSSTDLATKGDITTALSPILDGQSINSFADVETALATKQNATDNSLDTDAKTIVGAINEHEGDIDSLKSGLTNASSAIEELQAYTGYSSPDIIGIEVDYVNKSFRRLGAAVGKDGGSDFDAFPMFGGRRRCNVADDGTISKYYGDTGYAEDGSNGQVMVYQPKFYYKVVPLKLEKQSTGKGYHIRKAAYYVTATPMKGFKVHPAFVNASGNEVDYILVGASKGCIYDVSESAYILDDAQVMDNTADKFSSIFGVKPASGLSQDLTRPKIEQMCQNRGANWHELNVQMASMTQLLMLIEYGKFDMQRAIGKGVVDITNNSSYNCGATSGSTSALGNASGRATSTTIVTNTSTTYTDNGKTSVTYRGEEDPYGDMWEFVMGMNIYGNGSMNGGEPYICSDYDYAESKNTGNYKGASFTVANNDGYINAFGYGSEDFDWLFIASEVGGSDALPVGDYLWKTANLNGYRIALVGAGWPDSWGAGGFGWHLYGAVGIRTRTVAGRLAYIPA